MQDAVGSVTAVDVKTVKATAHYSFVDKGGCNGLAIDTKNEILFAACGRSGNPPTQPAQPMMVILSANASSNIAMTRNYPGTTIPLRCRSRLREALASRRPFCNHSLRPPELFTRNQALLPIQQKSTLCFGSVMT